MVALGCDVQEGRPNFTGVDSFVTQHEWVLNYQILAQETAHQIARGFSEWRQLFGGPAITTRSMSEGTSELIKLVPVDVG